MTIRQFIPLALVIEGLVVGGAHKAGLPEAPFGIFLAFGLTILLLQLEDHKIARAIHEVVDAFRADREHGHVH